MTTLAQHDLAADMEILRTLVRHNRLDLGAMGVLIGAANVLRSAREDWRYRP
jgi:hypothetical protein